MTPDLYMDVVIILTVGGILVSIIVMLIDGVGVQGGLAVCWERAARLARFARLKPAYHIYGDGARGCCNSEANRASTAQDARSLCV